MTAIEIKALQEVQIILKSVEMFPTYRVLSDDLESIVKGGTELKSHEKEVILNNADNQMRIQSKKVNSALDWINTLLKDQKP